MNATQPIRIPARLTVVVALAQLLQRLELSAVPVNPEQYRSVATRLTEALSEVPPDETLQAVLGAFPAAAELYENLQYRHAGLCRSPQELALPAEVKARELVQKLAAGARGGLARGG